MKNNSKRWKNLSLFWYYIQTWKQFLMCVHVCAWGGCMCIWEWACECVCRSKVNLECHSLGAFYLVFWNVSLHWPHQLCYTGWPVSPQIQLSLPLQWASKSTCLRPSSEAPNPPVSALPALGLLACATMRGFWHGFSAGSGAWTQVSLLAGQALYRLCHLPSLRAVS